MMQYFVMPNAMLFLGSLYSVYALLRILSYLGYYRGVFKQIQAILYANVTKVLIALVVLALLITLVDLPIAKLCGKYNNKDFYQFIDFIGSIALGWFTAGVLFTLVLIFEFFKKDNSAIIIKMALMASIYAGLFNGVIKFLFNRERPAIGLHPYNFFHFFLTRPLDFNNLIYAYNSMPSGHTITITAAMTPIFLYCKNIWIRSLVVFLVLEVIFSRIYTLNHWSSDTFVAVCLGVVIGYAIYQVNLFRVKS